MTTDDITDITQLTPMMQEYIKTKRKYKEEILFYRLGDFYEMFFEDAVTASREVEIALTSRSAGLEEKVPMAGIPYHAAEGYIKKFVNKGYKVAICEQLETAEEAEGLVKRDVIKIITPGTVTNFNLLDDSSSNYIMAIYKAKHSTSISVSDITTGIFLASEFTGNFSLVLDEISRFSPKEILVNTEIKDNFLNIIKEQFTNNITIKEDHFFDLDLNTFYQNSKLGFDLDFNKKENEDKKQNEKQNENENEKIDLMKYDFEFPKSYLDNNLNLKNNSKTKNTKSIKNNNKININDSKKQISLEEVEEENSEKNTNKYNLSEDIQKAILGLLRYFKETQKQDLENINSIEIYNIKEYMSLDISTRKNLEINNRIQDGKKRGSLYWILDKTNTSMGSRRLSRWINDPLIGKYEIEKRLNATEEFFENKILRGEIKKILKQIYDIERISGKIAYSVANAKDMISLKNSIYNLPLLKYELKDVKSEMLEELYENLDILDDIYTLIDKSILDNPKLVITEGDIIKPEFDEELFRLKTLGDKTKEYLAKLEYDEKEKTGIKNLKVGYNKVFGYFIEVTKSNLDRVPDRYIRKQTLTNAERYVTPELKELEEELLSSEEKIKSLEYKIFLNIRDEITKNIKRIQDTSKNISIIDVLVSFAEVAETNNYVKPKITNSKNITLKAGRHPVIEKILSKGEFVDNDTYLDGFNSTFLLITGPNMSGKSTYMRQVALIVLMAQIGSFVPAESAEIGIVDKIFTRIGASDDLGMGQSTFMVEMTEVANILNNATDKSLILLDEVGRGTSTYDGISIARSVLEHIADKEKLGARTLFSTHYHELVSLENDIKGLKNLHVTAETSKGNVIFLRKIKEGGTSDSYGLHVAKLAGVPNNVVKRAREILDNIEKKEIMFKKNEEQLEKSNESKIEGEQINLFDINYANLVHDIENIDIDNLTPIEALNKLKEIKEKAKNI